jgi:hypothetical protein
MLPLALALDLDLPVRSTATLLLEEPALEPMLASVEAGEPGTAVLPRLAAIRDAVATGPRHDPDDESADPREIVSALLGWAARTPHDDLPAFVARVRDAGARLRGLRRDDAPLILATAHGTKGLEFDEVAVIGMDERRFPSERTLSEAEDRGRAMEEERRLAYVAWTRARRVLTLVYDPLRPSAFLLEAFTPAELGLPSTSDRSAAMSRSKSA